MSYGRWLSRYGSAIPQWSNVESSMAFHFGLTLEEVWSMSWRRFVILFDSLWPRKDEDEEAEEIAGSKFNVIDDWNKAVGKTPRSSQPIELGEYMKKTGRTTRTV